MIQLCKAYIHLICYKRITKIYKKFLFGFLIGVYYVYYVKICDDDDDSFVFVKPNKNTYTVLAVLTV